MNTLWVVDDHGDHAPLAGDVRVSSALESGMRYEPGLVGLRPDDPHESVIPTVAEAD